MTCGCFAASGPGQFTMLTGKLIQFTQVSTRCRLQVEAQKELLMQQRQKHPRKSTRMTSSHQTS